MPEQGRNLPDGASIRPDSTQFWHKWHRRRYHGFINHTYFFNHIWNKVTETILLIKQVSLPKYNKCTTFYNGSDQRSEPVFCPLLGVSSRSARSITGQVISINWPVIGWAHELTPGKRQKADSGRSHHELIDVTSRQQTPRAFTIQFVKGKQKKTLTPFIFRGQPQPIGRYARHST